MNEPSDPLEISCRAGDRRIVPAAVLGFGRDAELVLDRDNAALHRLAGRFVWQPLVGWTLENRCTAVAMVLTDHDSASYARVVPGGTMPLPFADTSIAFRLAGIDYRLDTHRPALAALTRQARYGHTSDASRLEHREPENSGPVLPALFAPTERASRCPPLNAEQAALLRQLVAPRLFGPISASALPSNHDLADRLGWSLPKLNRKLDHLCGKFARFGVDGLVGDRGRCASERRLRLVDAIVENRWLDALTP